MLLWFGLLASAYAESMATESLDWAAADCDVVVRAAVVGGTPNAIAGDAWVDETVTVSVLEVIDGPVQPETLTWTWRTREGSALQARPGAQIVLFLTRGEDGGLAPRSSMQGYVDLGRPDAWTASTAACEVLDDGQQVLAYVRDVASRPPLAGPASHWRTWDWWRPGSERRACDADTETFRALWAGSDVAVIVALSGTSPR